MSDEVRMVRLYVDNRPVEVPADTSVLRACEIAGAQIPRFCYHEALSIAGNCRMCLVRVAGEPKPVASCARTVSDLRPARGEDRIEVTTVSSDVEADRRGVMEFLLINHPLDCPICDQGGECDLQDQSIIYGFDKSRFEGGKRAVEEKNLGPLVKTAMTRCIHCTRCVRFMQEIAGTGELATVGRGGDMEITSYLNASLTSELQSNIVDLCPVGALVSRPYSFQARPWELEHIETIDVMDALGSNIRMDVRGGQVMRILPRTNSRLNEEWISDKTRHVTDGLRRKRIVSPFVRDAKGAKKLQTTDWQSALKTTAQLIANSDPSRVAVLAGPLSSVEDLMAWKMFASRHGVTAIDGRQTGSVLCGQHRASYLFGPTPANLMQSDALLLIGCNPRSEAPLLNSRIYRAVGNGATVGVVGGISQPQLNYPYVDLGASGKVLAAIENGEHEFASVLRDAKHPSVIVGEAAFCAPHRASALVAGAARIALSAGAVTQDWNGFGVLHRLPGAIGAMDIGFYPASADDSARSVLSDASRFDVVIALGFDEVEIPSGPRVIYVGSHGDRGASRADVVLPSASYCEKSASYVNLFGDVQMTNRAIFPPGEAKEEWSIVLALAKSFDYDLKFKDVAGLRELLLANSEKLGAPSDDYSKITAALEKLAQMDHGSADVEVIVEHESLLDNPIARASQLLGQLLEHRHEQVPGHLGTVREGTEERR